MRYYRKYIKDYSYKAGPLTLLKTKGFKSALLKSNPKKTHMKQTYLDASPQEKETNNNIVLDQECKEAWDTLKKELFTAPLLTFPDFNHSFILYCDRSKQKGYDAALH